MHPFNGDLLDRVCHSFVEIPRIAPDRMSPDSPGLLFASSTSSWTPGVAFSELGLQHYRSQHVEHHKVPSRIHLGDR